MSRTFIACLVVLGLFAWATAQVTRGFEHWTFEDVRRADAQAGRLVASPVRVRTSSGREVTLWTAPAEAGAVTIVDFVYTRCITVCQALGSEFAQMQAALSADRAGTRRLHLVSLSLDSDRDGMAELAAYARRHRADPALWTVAAPSSPDTSRQLLHELRVIAVPDGLGGFVHNGAIHVLDGRGVVRGIYDTAQWREALRAARRLAAETS